jgi:methyl-accepting chemotaxis protein
MTSESAEADPAVPLPAAPYRTGAAARDAEHLRIFTALQRLEESLGGPFPLETLGPRLKQLEELLLDHFRHEEAFLAEAGYPLLGAHKVEHEVALDRCHALLDRFSQPGSPPLVRLARQFQAALLRHIGTVDRDYADFLGLGGRNQERDEDAQLPASSD